ncbi:MAG: DUF362 domain-containing protein [Nanoarchaeota archaeon]|nr:DUF362 domain-containing protein [Nanoarchaeota archaeon]
MKQSKVAILRTKPETVIKDYRELMNLADYQKEISKAKETILKLNLSWSLYYPACSTEPWQLHGVLDAMEKEGFDFKKLHAVENETVVTDVWKGAKHNKWLPLLKKYNLKYEPLTEVKWVKYKPKAEMLALDNVFKPHGSKSHEESIYSLPEMFIGKNVMHFPTLKCVHPDTEIFLADGALVKIKDVVDKIHDKSLVETTYDFDKVAEDIKEIISLNSNGKLKTALSYKFWKTPIGCNNIIKITTKTGKEVKISSVHPFLTPSGWRVASELKAGERIAIPRKIMVNGKSQPLPKIKSLNHNNIDVEKISFKKGKKYSIKFQKNIIKEYLNGKTTTSIADSLNIHFETVRNIIKRYGVDIRWRKHWHKAPQKTSKEFWKWWGYFTAEGFASNCQGSMRFWWCNGNAEIVSDYKNLVKNLFEIKLKEKKDKSKNPKKADSIVYYMDSNHLKDFLEKIDVKFPLIAATKKVLPLLFKCPDEEISAFLEGYLDGDGTVAKDGLHATTKSEALARGAVNLFLRLGSVAFKKKTYCRATNSTKMDKSLYHKISIYGDELVNLSDKLQFISKNKQENMVKLVEKRGKGKKPSNWDTLPLNPKEFRKVREGLGFTQASTGKPNSVNSIENRYSLPTKQVVRYFIKIFEQADTEKRFKDEIFHMKFLASEDICWDYITKSVEVQLDTSYLYDLSVFGTNNFIGEGIVLHNTHGHTQMTGAQKNAFGGLITTRRHHCHKKIHEVLVDLLQIQKEIHPGMFAVMDGTVAGDGAGPRTMHPKIKNVVLASSDQVAIDAVAAHMMGFDPLKIPFIKMAHDKGLGVGDVDQIDIAGISKNQFKAINFHFETNKSPVIFWDQMLRRKLKFIEPLLFHTPLFKMCVLGSAFYHDYIWYNIIGRLRISKFMKTDWGKLWKTYK